MPDLFEGDVAPNASTFGEEDLAAPEEDESQHQGGGFLDMLKLKAAETAKSFMIDMWLARHTEEKVFPLLEKVIEGARAEFADAVAAGNGIYAVGYCFGGRYVLLLAAERTPPPPGFTGATRPADAEAAIPTKKGPFIRAGALAHATLVSPEDFEGLKAPVSLVCVESDPMFPDDVRTQGEDLMGKLNLEHEVQVYPGVPHGKHRIRHSSDMAHGYSVTCLWIVQNMDTLLTNDMQALLLLATTRMRTLRKHR
jgi:dienelactone hydrolase